MRKDPCTTRKASTASYGGNEVGTRRYLKMDKLRAVEVEKESALGVA